MPKIYILIIVLSFYILNICNADTNTDNKSQSCKTTEDNILLFMSIDVFAFIITKCFGIAVLCKGNLILGYLAMFLCLGFFSHLMTWGIVNRMSLEYFWIATELIGIIYAGLIGIYVASREKRIENLREKLKELIENDVPDSNKVVNNDKRCEGVVTTVNNGDLKIIERE